MKREERRRGIEETSCRRTFAFRVHYNTERCDEKSAREKKAHVKSR